MCVCVCCCCPVSLGGWNVDKLQVKLKDVGWQCFSECWGPVGLLGRRTLGCVRAFIFSACRVMTHLKLWHAWPVSTPAVDRPRVHLQRWSQCWSTGADSDGSNQDHTKKWGCCVSHFHQCKHGYTRWHTHNWCLLKTQAEMPWRVSSTCIMAFADSLQLIPPPAVLEWKHTRAQSKTTVANIKCDQQGQEEQSFTSTARNCCT